VRLESSDNNAYAYVDSAKVYIRAIGMRKPRRIGRDTTEVSGKDTTRAKVRLSINRWSYDGKKILASSAKGYWLLDTESGAMEDVYRFPRTVIRHRHCRLLTGATMAGSSL
jgi:hypothetical protein